MIEGSCLCGATGWRFDGTPQDATICNCTACRRYGVLWAYDWVDGRIATQGEARAYTRPAPDAELGFHFCPRCGCLLFWRGLNPQADGRTRIAVNLRLANHPAEVAALPLRKFDGLDSFEDMPSNNRHVADVWW